MLFGPNLVSNISTKAQKHYILCQIYTLLVQKRCKFNGRFGYVNYIHTISQIKKIYFKGIFFFRVCHITQLTILYNRKKCIHIRFMIKLITLSIQPWYENIYYLEVGIKEYKDIHTMNTILHNIYTFKRKSQVHYIPVQYGQKGKKKVIFYIEIFL